MSANDRSPGNKRRYDDKISGHMEKASEVNEDFNKIMEDIAKIKSGAVERSGHPVTLYRYSSVPNFVDAGQFNRNMSGGVLSKPARVWKEEAAHHIQDHPQDLQQDHVLQNKSYCIIERSSGLQSNKPIN